MKQIISVSVLIMSALAGTACTHDPSSSEYLLGSATAHNIAIQSERDVTLPNVKTVDSISGVRAGNAVKALNESEGRTFDQATASDGGNG